MKGENKMNRKGYLLIFIILISSSYAGAQVGIKFGLNINHMKYSYKNDDSLKNPVTLQIGVFFTWNLSRKISLQPELYYSRSGSKEIISYPDQTFKVEEQYSYLRLPFLAKLRLLSKGNWRLSPLCGLYGAYNLSADQKSSYGSKESSFSTSIRSSTNPIDLGFISGFEIGSKLGKGTVLLDLRLSFGLVDINTNERGQQTVYNRMLVLQVGYQFGK